MQKIKQIILAFVAISSLSLAVVPVVAAENQDPGGGGACREGRFLTFPTWYRGLVINQETCTIKISALEDTWTIVLNLIEIMMQAAGYVAAGIVTWGGFKYIKSQGNPQNIAGAKTTIMNGAIGLGVALSAVAVVNFIAVTIK